MPTTTRPVGMRLELREWYWDSNLCAYFGTIHEDVKGIYIDGMILKIKPSELLEVRPCKDVVFFDLVNGEKYFGLTSERISDK